MATRQNARDIFICNMQKEVEDFISQEKELYSFTETENFKEVKDLTLEINQPSSIIQECLEKVKKFREEAPPLIEKIKTSIEQKNFQALASEEEQFYTYKQQLTDLDEQLKKAYNQATISAQSFASKKILKEISGPIQELVEQNKTILEQTKQGGEQQKLLETKNTQILESKEVNIKKLSEEVASKDAIIKNLNEQVEALKVELKKKEEVVQSLEAKMAILDKLKEGVDKIVGKLCPVEDPTAQM